MRTNRFRTIAVTATALVAALSLTACGGDDKAMGTKPAGTADTAAPAATSTDDKARPESDAPEAAKPETQTVPAEGKHAGGNGDGDNHGKKPEAGPNGEAAAEIPACTPKNSTVEVSSVSRPINHLLLTVTNTGSTRCSAYYAPFLRFDGAQAVYPILDDSKPQAVVTLAPGEEAYAGIGLLGEPGQNEPVPSDNLGVIMVDKNNKSKGETTLKLPADTATDGLGFVTYWQSDVENALMF
ncbi:MULTISPECIES: DUF4232 domain-containing protein [Streptomyces]|uniref:DUF4232 domain-containing protein n=2 Tax=Streptomyces griseus TaxID=1911 RepID=B1VTA9_STRGG|nr:DUF4232 domain-containing protein [Streptomyces griseus]MYR09684.1 DUF4232 domain-containing protein [Streptomyces sp. SID724]MBW3706657.1 DUF4232 domain-containing protein [Streptomyces griseus]NEB55680.1 DUF4232 domain-containing protein [Streptomyces griseus]SEE72213.1 Protein of unknown function [Streptomyces griseus]SQA27137.1 DUF4232 domain containing protein [Streptomyces griseus]